MTHRSTMRAGPRGKVLVVDDEAALRRLMARALEQAGHEVVQAEDGNAALVEVNRQQFDAILSDISMPGLDGVQLLREVRARDLDVPVILLTGNPSVESAMQAVEYGAFEYLAKPVELERIRTVVTRALGLGRIARAKRTAIEAFGRSHHQDLRRHSRGPCPRSGRRSSRSSRRTARATDSKR